MEKQTISFATLSDTTLSEIAKKTDLTNLDASISSRASQTDLNTVKTDTNTVKTDVSTIKSNTSSTKTDVGTIKTQTSSIKTTVENLATVLSNISDSILDLNTKIQNINISSSEEVDVSTLFEDDAVDPTQETINSWSGKRLKATIDGVTYPVTYNPSENCIYYINYSSNTINVVKVTFGS